MASRTADVFSRLFEEEYDFVWHSLRRLGVQSRDLEDLAHDTFLKVHANLDRYDPSRPIRPWLFAFCFRLASDYRRLARHRTDLGADPEAIEASGGTVEDIVADREARRIAEEAILEIPLDQRAVFVLYELDEVPIKTIATALEIPANTAYSRLRLAREAFATAVRRVRRPENPR